LGISPAKKVVIVLIGRLVVVNPPTESGDNIDLEISLSNQTPDTTLRQIGRAANGFENNFCRHSPLVFKTMERIFTLNSGKQSITSLRARILKRREQSLNITVTGHCKEIS
jgi:hypothetical protein